MKKFTFFFCFLVITISLKAQRVNVHDDYQFRSPGINGPMNNYALNPIQNKCFVAKPSAGQDTKSFSAPTTGTFNAFMEWQMNNYHWPGMQVGILHNGELLWKNNYGMANIE